MFDALQPACEPISRERPRQLVLHAGALPAGAQLAQHIGEVRPMLSHEQEALQPPRARVAVDGEHRHVRELRARLAQTVGDRLRGEAGPVLDAPKALFLRRSHQLAIHQDGRRRITVIRVDPQNDAHSNLFSRCVRDALAPAPNGRL
jgi:hypothetical protein